MDVDDFIGRDAEFLAHFIRAYFLGLHAIQHDNARADQLHQIFIRRHDRHIATGVDDIARVSGDEVIGFVVIEFDGGDVEGFDRIADQRKLGNELFRRWRPVCLVFWIDLVAESFPARIEYDGDVGWRFRRLALANELPQHGAKAMHGPDRQTVGRPGQGRQRMEGTKDVARAVDQVDVAAFGDRRIVAIGVGRRTF